MNKWTILSTKKVERLDIIGSIIYGSSLVALMYGFSMMMEILGIWLILISIIGLAAFVLWEMKIKNPVLDMHLFRNNTVFTFSILAALITPL